MNLLLINGPNLNLLGQREPEIYGSKTLKNIEDDITNIANQKGFELICFQDNCEGNIINFIQNKSENASGILINAGALTHTSIALRDALLGVHKPYVEIHLSNTFTREEFRHKSYLSDKAIGIVSGFGALSYQLALHGLIDYLK